MDADSIASVIWPTQALRLTRQPYVPEYEVYHPVSAPSFFLCLSCVTLLSCGIGSIIISLYIFFNHLPYLFIKDVGMFLSITGFILASGILCFPTSWLSWATHNRATNLLMMLVVILSISLFLLSAGAWLALDRRSYIVLKWDINKPMIPARKGVQSYSPRIRHLGVFIPLANAKYPKLQSGKLRSSLNDTMMELMLEYDKKETHRSILNSLQAKLYCCGSDHPTDWYNFRANIPESCCEEESLIHQETGARMCPSNAIFTYGCLDAIAYDLYMQMSLVAGFSFILIFLQLFSLILSFIIYMKNRGTRAEIVQTLLSYNFSENNSIEFDVSLRNSPYNQRQNTTSITN